MSSKIDIRKIVYNHFSTIVDYDTKKASINDWLTFLVFPLCISGYLALNKVFLDDSIVEILVGALSIFVGLLFSLLLFVFDLIKKDNVIRVKRDLAKEVIHNIAFSIVVAILSNLFLLLSITHINSSFTKAIFNFISDFLLIEFTLTLLMILKRMYVLILDEIKDIERSDKT